jgi:hypothetical protein
MIKVQTFYVQNRGRMQGKVPNLVANERFQPLWLIEGFNLGGFENNPMFGDQ